MQRTSIKVINAVVIFSSLFFATCKVDLPLCEEWEVTDKESSSGSLPDCSIDWSCGGSRTLNLEFCGESLKDASAGNTIILNATTCCKTSRTFVRRIRRI